ncbi:ArsR/SmtB family transcription factor [Halomicrococcus gelatinilyticus]|uniref:ArsR/SmtB family transcription factor n=1 Tax=Halomicrococcus gelatinilyticus TaxID=1702103 RepID=UPI002E143F0A
MSEDCELQDVAALLEDEVARTILTETNVEPMSANELSDRCGTSEATVYRRLDRLSGCALVTERTRLDDDGHHHKVYEPNLERLTVELTGDSFSFRIERTETKADRFTRLVEEM